MPLSKVSVVLLCNNCEADSEHVLIYEEDTLIRSECQQCHKEVVFSEANILTLYSKEMALRILTKPKRINQELKRNLGELIQSLPSRIVSKPQRVMKEVRDVMKEESRHKKSYS